MEFNFTPQEDAFREKVQTFLRTNLPEGWGSTEFEMPEELQGKQFYGAMAPQALPKRAGRDVMA